MAWQYMFPLLTMGLKPAEFAVAMQLANVMPEKSDDKKGAVKGEVQMFYEVLAEKCSVQRSTVIEAVRRLEKDHKLIEVIHTGGLNAKGHGRGGFKVPNTFRAKWEPKEQSQEESRTGKGPKNGPFTQQT